MIVGCYALDLYCDNENREQEMYPDKAGNMVIFHWEAWQYTGNTGSQARNQARKAGWKLNLKEGTAICPRCTRAIKENNDDPN